MTSQSLSINTRSGWSEQETNRLWQEIRVCTDSGQPLRTAFDRMAELTGRKANSIRNYYYSAVKSGEAPCDVPTGRAVPFRPFSDEEIDALLRDVLSAQGRGISVRACVTELSGGDRAKALRLQNKYRALLKSHPERVLRALNDLRAQGQPCIDPYRKLRSLPRESSLFKDSANQLVHHLLARTENMDENTSRRYLALCLQIADLLETP